MTGLENLIFGDLKDGDSPEEEPLNPYANFFKYGLPPFLYIFFVVGVGLTAFLSFVFFVSVTLPETSDFFWRMMLYMTGISLFTGHFLGMGEERVLHLRSNDGKMAVIRLRKFIAAPHSFRRRGTTVSTKTSPRSF